MKSSRLVKVLTLGTIFYQTLGGADQLRILSKNSEALQARVDLIRSAKKNLRVEYFEAGPTEDKVTTTGLALMVEAARDRGIEVQIILDGLNSKVSNEMISLLQTDKASGPGSVRVKIFDKLNLAKLGQYGYRDHAKMLNIDGEAMIIGDRNAGCEYFSLCPSEQTLNRKNPHYSSVDVIVAGKAAGEAAVVFDELWNNPALTKTPTPVLSLKQVQELVDKCENRHLGGCEADEVLLEKYLSAQRALSSDLEELKAGSFSQSMGVKYLGLSLQNWVQQSPNYNVQYLYDRADSRVGSSNMVVATSLARIFGSRLRSGDEFNFATPYLILDNFFDDGLTGLKENKVKATAITNSLRSTDELIAYAGYRGGIFDLANLSSGIYEYSGRDHLHYPAANPSSIITLHTKIASLVTRQADGRLSRGTTFIGSFNFDPRSEKINREIGIVVSEDSNPTFAQAIDGILSDLKRDSILVGGNGQLVFDYHEKIDFAADVSDQRRRELNTEIDVLKKTFVGIKFLLPNL